MKRPAPQSLRCCAELLLNCGDDSDRELRHAVSDWLAHLSSEGRRRKPRKPPRIVSPAEARELFSYDPQSGYLLWRDESRNGGRSCIGRINSHGHLVVSINGTTHMVHRVIWAIVTGSYPAHLIDHKDGKPANNAWTNLREATTAQNAHNRRKLSNASPYPKGVTPWAGKFRAQIKVKNRGIHLGLFSTPEAAGAAYAEAALLHFGEFARS